jgi:hypothetical protein
MRIVFLTHCCPGLFSNGGAEICWTILDSFKKRNYKITLIILGTSEEYEKSKRNINKIKELVDDVILYKSEREDTLYNIFLKNPFYFFFPPQQILMPAFKHKQEVENVIKKLNPECIFVYDWHAAPCVIDIDIKKILIVGDLLHFPFTIGIFSKRLLGKKIVFSFKRFFQILGTLWVIFHLKKFQIKLMNFFDSGGSFGFWDAKWLKNSGVKFSKYYKTPYYDTKKIYFSKKIPAKFEKKKFKILTGLGRLHATATSAGLYFLYRKLIPLINKYIGEENYEIHILGDGFLNEKTEKIKNYPNVFVRGYVNDLHYEIETSDAFLLATPIFLGYRCRLLNSAALSQCLILHRSDVINQPEFISGQNCMIGNSPKEIVLNLKSVLKNSNLRKKLKKNVREMYLSNFEPSIAMEKIFEEIEK